MDNPTSGVFRDPAGNLMTLTSTSPEAFRVLVTRKLEKGWAFCKESPVVKPLFDETRLALPPAYEEINVYPAADPDPLPAPPPLPPGALSGKAPAFAFTTHLPGLTPADDDE